MLHEDDAGNRGVVTSGSVQWMTAGGGIVHSEMPQHEDGMLWGFQLWVRRSGAARVGIFAGELGGVSGPVEGVVTEPLLLDARLVVLGDGDHVHVRAGGGGARMLLGAAHPLGEPVSRYGPFVMNTPEEIQQAIADQRAGRLTR